MKTRTFAGVATAVLLSSVAVPFANHSNITNSVTTKKVSAESTTQSNFLNVATPYAVQAAKYYGIYPSVMLSQAIVESGWGQSTLATQANNLFGMKGSFNGNSYTVSTREEDSNGNSYYINAAFRAYPSWSASFADNGLKLRTGTSDKPTRYSGTWLENCNSYTDSTQGLVNGGYATSHSYATNLNSCIATNNLTKYDPKISTAIKTVTASQSSATYDSPADPSFAKKTGTISAGQAVKVDKTITYSDGTSRMHTAAGWVDGSALNGASSQAPSKPSTSNTNYSVTSTSGVVKIKYISGYSIAVWDKPNGHTTGQYLKDGTNWKITGYTTINGKKWYRVGTNQWIDAQYTTDGTTSKPGASSSQAPSATISMTKHESVVTIKYVPGYGIAVWQKPAQGATGKYLPDSSRWKTMGYTMVNGHKWYNLGGNQWIDSQYATEDGTTSTDTKTVNSNAATTTNIEKTSGILTINYIPGYSIVMWGKPGSNPLGKYLKTGTNWKFYGKTEYKGQTWYNLGGNQWVPAQYIKVK